MRADLYQHQIHQVHFSGAAQVSQRANYQLY